MMEENIQNLTNKEIRDKLLKLRENRKREYTQSQRKKPRPAELAVNAETADKLMEKIKEAGGLDALLEQEGLADDEDN